VQKGRCATHARQADQGTRGTAQQRGYTYRWSQYSQAWLRQHPVCGEQQDGTITAQHGSSCAAQKLTIPAACTDHIVPVSAGGEFWAPANHQSLCLACNTRKANTLERRGSQPATRMPVQSSGTEGLQTAPEGSSSARGFESANQTDGGIKWPA